MTTVSKDSFSNFSMVHKLVNIVAKVEMQLQK